MVLEIWAVLKVKEEEVWIQWVVHKITTTCLALPTCWIQRKKTQSSVDLLITCTHTNTYTARINCNTHNLDKIQCTVKILRIVMKTMAPMQIITQQIINFPMLCLIRLMEIPIKTSNISSNNKYKCWYNFSWNSKMDSKEIIMVSMDLTITAVHKIT